MPLLNRTLPLSQIHYRFLITTPMGPLQPFILLTRYSSSSYFYFFHFLFIFLLSTFLPLLTLDPMVIFILWIFSYNPRLLFQMSQTSLPTTVNLVSKSNSQIFLGVAIRFGSSLGKRLFRRSESELEKKWAFEFCNLIAG